MVADAKGWWGVVEGGWGRAWTGVAPGFKIAPKIPPQHSNLTPVAANRLLHRLRKLGVARRMGKVWGGLGRKPRNFTTKKVIEA